MKPGIYEMPADAYHADPCPEPSLSASVLKLLLGNSPLHAKLAHPRLTPDATARETTFESDCGTAAHALLLEGVDLIEVIDAPDYKTKAAREARDAAREAGRVPLLPHQAASARAMAAAARAQLAEHEASDAFTAGKPERVMIWREGETWCRARADWLPDDPRGYLDDYKTTSMAANPETWDRRLTTAGYDIQAAFYLRGFQAITGTRPAGFRFIVQETETPYLLSVLQPAPDMLDYAERKIASGLATWRHCLRTGEWPGYPRRVCHVAMPAWAAMRWDEREIREDIAA